MKKQLKGGKTKVKSTILMSMCIAICLIVSVLPLTIAQELANEEVQTNSSQEIASNESLIVSELDNENESVSEAEMFGKRLGLFFTFNKEKKAEKQVQLARLELIRARMALKKNNTLAMENALEDYYSLMEKVRKTVESSDEKNLKETNKSADWLVGIERAIEVHQLKIERLNELISNDSNLSQEQIANIQARINKSQQSIDHLTQVEQAKRERIKMKLMAFGNMSEEQAEKKLEELENSKNLSEIRAYKERYKLERKQKMANSSRKGKLQNRD